MLFDSNQELKANMFICQQIEKDYQESTKLVSKGSFISCLQYYAYLQHFISKEKEEKCCLTNKSLGYINCLLLTLKKIFGAIYVYLHNNFPGS